MKKRVGNWTGKHTRQISKEEMKEVGEFIKSMRLSIGLDKVQMGRELGVHQTTIRRWEEEFRIPHRDIDDLIDDVRDVVKKYRAMAG